MCTIKSAKPSQTKNGKEAINSLRDYYEGEDFIENYIKHAFSALNNTFYKGEHNNFNFEKFFVVHLEVQYLLNEAQYNNGTQLIFSI